MIERFEDREALARAVATLFADQALKSVDVRGCFSVLLAGGETPRRAYQLLAQEPYLGRIPWRDVHFFWGDERCVPSDDPRSNQLMVRTALLDHLPVCPDQIHPIACNETPQQSADLYEAELRGYFDNAPLTFDLALLGLGNDGHTASLFPGSTALDEHRRWTAVTHRAGEDFSRVTLTAPLLNQAALVLFMVTGSAKARVLKAIMGGGNEHPMLPAQLVRPLSGDLRWFVDREAASMLNEMGDSDGDEVAGVRETV